MHIQITELFYLAYTALISEGPNESLAWFVTCENIKEIAPWLWKLILRVRSWGPADAGTTSSSPAPRYLEDFAETLSLPNCPCFNSRGNQVAQWVSQVRLTVQVSTRPVTKTLCFHTGLESLWFLESLAEQRARNRVIFFPWGDGADTKQMLSLHCFTVPHTFPKLRTCSSAALEMSELPLSHSRLFR